MSLFLRMSPGYSPPAVRQKGDLFVLKDRVLQTILAILCGFGLPSVILAVADETANGKYVIAAFYIAVYILFLGLLIARDLPYNLRGLVVVAVAYLLAVSELFSSGQLGEVRMFLVAFIVLTSVLFKYRAVFLAVVLSLTTIIVPGLYAAAALEPIVPSLGGLNQGTGWFTSSVVFLMIASMTAGSISMIIAGLERNLARQAELSTSLAKERESLAERIDERTRSIAHRLVQLRTAAEISHTISGLSDPDTLMHRVVDLVKDRFDLYYVGVFLLDATREYAVLQAGTGEAGRIMRLEGHRLLVGGSSMIGWAIANRAPRIALDVGAEAIRFSNPHLPATRSELALPITARDIMLGAMTVQSDRPEAFDEDDIAVLKSIADSLAVALENDRLYQETRRSLDEVRVLNREYLHRAWAETAETSGVLSFSYNNPLVPAQPAGKTIQVPLVLRDEVIGHLDLEIDRDELTGDEAAFVEVVTTQAAIALENARLLQETERRAIQEEKLNELAARFSRALSIDEILRAAVQELGQLPAVAGVSVQLDPGGSPQKPAASARRAGQGNGKEGAR